MRKLYNHLLFFTFVFVFSSFAAEEVSTITTVKATTSQMSDVIGILCENNASLKETASLIEFDETYQMSDFIKNLGEDGVNLKETVFFFDFDETLATTVGVYKGHEFKLLFCPDKNRTYKQVFSAAFQKFSYASGVVKDLEDSENSPLVGRYEILDQDATDLISKLCEEAYFAGVCSALEKDETGLKNELMKSVGLDTENYIFAGQGKPQAICEHLVKIAQPNKKITTVVLIDNSEEFAIKPFLEKMPGLVKKLGFSDLKIIGIEFTKFAEMATQEAIEKELALLETLCKEGS